MVGSGYHAGGSTAAGRRFPFPGRRTPDSTLRLGNEPQHWRYPEGGRAENLPTSHCQRFRIALSLLKKSEHFIKLSKLRDYKQKHILCNFIYSSSIGIDGIVEKKIFVLS
jgi:hypothetical protein